MKKVFKRTLVTFLTVIMLFSVLPLAVSATSVDGLEYVIENGEVTITGCDYSVSEELVIPSKIEGNLVTSIGESAFYNRKSLKSVIIPNSVTSIGDLAFASCKCLTNISIPESITSISYGTFEYCTSLTSITIPDSVTSIGDYAFEYCTNLENVTIPKSVTSIGNLAFLDCYSLISIEFPDSVISIGEGAFLRCESLTGIEISCSITSIGDSAFRECENLARITVDKNNKYYCNDEYGALYNKNKTELIQYPAANTRTTFIIPDSVINIDDWAFCDCRSLVNIEIPTNVKSIGNWAFFNCVSLIDIIIGNGVISIGDSAFQYCYDLTSIEIPNSVTSIGDGAFWCCESLTSITIGNSVASIGDNAFFDCESLISIKIPDSTTNIGDAVFYECESLTNITVDKNNRYYYSDEYGVLYNINKTELIQYPNGNTRTVFDIPDSVTSISYGAFYHCTNLTSITIPNSVKNIGDYAFEYCYNLTSIEISDSVTSIGSGTFKCCWELISVTISNKATSIGDYAFGDCESLTNIYYDGTEEQWNKIAIGDYNAELLNATIHFAEPVHTHTYTHISIPAACTADGTEYDICSECNDVINSKTISAIGHDWSEWIVTQDATCTESGTLRRVCSECLKKEKLTISALGHDYMIAEKEVTCETDGGIYHVCSRCGDTYITDEVKATGHNWSKWYTVEMATIDSTGLMLRYCENCDKLEKKSIPCIESVDVKSIKISSDDVTVLVGSDITLSVLISPENSTNKNVLWSTSDSRVAVVNNGTVTAKMPGTAVITATTENGKYQDFCLIRVVGITASNSDVVIDTQNSMLFGLSSYSDNLNECFDFSVSEITVEAATEIIGTGTEINIERNGIVIGTYNAVVFGDVNGDGWYDGMDAMIVDCIANGIMSEKDVSEAAYIAADCNHDGIINQLDVDILNQAGLLLSAVDQSESQEALIETNSAYAKYINLIDQNPRGQSETTDYEKKTEETFFQIIIEFINKFIAILKTYISKFN